MDLAFWKMPVLYLLIRPRDLISFFFFFSFFLSSTNLNFAGKLLDLVFFSGHYKKLIRAALAYFGWEIKVLTETI